MPVQVQLPGYNHNAPAVGLAELVNSGFGAYKSYKQSQLADTENTGKELQNQQVQIGAQQNAKHLAALNDPNSPESKMTKAGGSSLLNGLQTTGILKGDDAAGLRAIIEDPATTGFQVHQTFESSPVLKSLTGLGEAKAKADAMAISGQARADGVLNQKDKIAASAADHFDKDPILTKITKQRQQVDLDKHTLETAPVLTPQIINEIQQGIANAISGGGSAGLGKTEQTEMHTAQQKIADIQQRFTGDPTPVNDPALVQYFHGVLDRLGQAYDRNGYTRAQQILNGRAGGYKSNPAAIQVMKDKTESYRPADPAQAPGAAGAGPGGAMSFQEFMNSKAK